MKIKLNKKEVELLKFIINKTIDYGWESCLGGYGNNDKRAIKKHESQVKMLLKISDNLKIQ